MNGNLDDSPYWRRDKALTVGLPGTRQVRSAQVQAIFLTIAQNVDCNPRKARCVHVAAMRGEIQSDLNKAAVVLKSDRPLHPDGRAAGDTAERIMCPEDTPPMTASETICHRVPMAAWGYSLERSSIVAGVVIMELLRDSWLGMQLQGRKCPTPIQVGRS